MKTIVAARTDVTKLLGRQRLKNGPYRLMKFILQANCEDGLLLHNCITGQLILLTSQEASALNDLPTTPDQNMIALIEDHFLVPLDYDEKATVDNLRLLMKKLFTSNEINGYTIMVTTNCNARCFYCYQANFPHINMTEETADHLVKYMIQHKGSDPLRIQWFGGEPLVGIARIDQVSSALRKQGIEFTSSMISNGYLFTEAVIERAARDWKLKNIQITLDGTEEIYNRTKAYRSAEESPYKRVLQNITILLNYGVHVGLRLNLDQHNEEDLVKLISEIKRLIPNKEHLNVYAHVIYEDEGYAPIARGSSEREELYRKQLQINKLIIDEGLSKLHLSLPSIRYRSCMADNPQAMVVYPDGHLYKCEHTVKDDEFGHIDGLTKDESKIKKYAVPSSLKMCEKCQLYPSCYILKECDGLKERNNIICGFDVTQKVLGLVQYYRKYQTKNEIPNFEMKEKPNIPINC